MNTFVRCGSLFTGIEDEPRKSECLVHDAAGEIVYVGPDAKAPRRNKADRVFDYTGFFVMPGLIDVHTHLAYGNAKCEEDIDLYSPLEFRTLPACSSRRNASRPATPRSARRAMPARSRCRSATR